MRSTRGSPGPASSPPSAPAAATSYGATIAVRDERRYPPTVNTPEEAALCARVAQALVGEARVSLTPRPAMGSEDFA
jgi:metal-dependent amidase/aminoacylase/carboxypeptidase family protein